MTSIDAESRAGLLEIQAILKAESLRQVAKRLLRRIDSPELTQKQVEVFRNPPFDEFCDELHRWAAEPVDYVHLLEDFERYERSHANSDALTIARAYNVIRWSTHSEVEALANLINTHYRNSNVRVALSSELLNRLLPDPFIAVRGNEDRRNRTMIGVQLGLEL